MRLGLQVYPVVCRAVGRKRESITKHTDNKIKNLLKLFTIILALEYIII